MLTPRKPVPDLTLPLAGGGEFTLSKEGSERGTVVCFYRGLHCPICAAYLSELARLAPEFQERGYDVIAISSDEEDRAKEMQGKLRNPLRIAYGLKLADAKAWGLYISEGRGKTSIDIEEPKLFSEPGLFIVNSDQTLFFGSTQTMPFTRPHFSELVKAVDFTIAKNYPARGEYTGAV